jgi:tetratricopeptide (TPR) repeat protein
VPEEKLLFVQLNHLGDSGRIEQTFAEFTDELWRAVDELDIDRFVLDIRYNIGGDGSLVLPFVHEIIKRDAIDRKGTLFAVVGRATFSAGVMLARALEEHTAVTFVGEPPGAYWKHYGDGTSFELPASGLVVWVSTIYHQLSSYAGDQRALGIELPAPFSSADWLGGGDPALAEIRASADRALLANVFREQGAAAGLAAYEERLAHYGGVDWWEPFTLQSLNSIGHELLDAGRYEDALAAYRLNARRHPEHWRVWYSLGRAQRRQGDLEAAIANYEKALAVDPFNNLAPFQREALEEMRSQPPGAQPK